ncbi:MAG: hypothetical protein JWN53_2395 [Gemmatimonadetes bacterium]|nr:hypothetical protein [Gemmatimonadota bacterium]
MLARGGAIALSIAVVLGMGAGALAARTRAPAPAADPQTMTTTTSEKMVTLATTSARGAAAPAAVARPRVLAPAPVVAPTEPTAPTGAWTPVLATGRTELADSMYALNAVDGISVHFDTQDLRTRRRDKFEHVVRATLPAVYGARADSLLATIPDGQLAAGGDLLSELPTRGITLPARDGWAVTLWPATRPGRDGPLVVSYRVTARAR